MNMPELSSDTHFLQNVGGIVTTTKQDLSDIVTTTKQDLSDIVTTTKQDLSDIIINTYPNNHVPKFSILMPVHNEQDSISNVVLDVHNKLGKNPNLPFEIILSE